MNEDTPTEPGRRLSNLRVHRTLVSTINEPVFFDTPVNAVMYVGVRKSTLRARRLGVTWVIWMGALTAGAYAIIMTIVVNGL
jgi:hypothetical protein